MVAGIAFGCTRSDWIERTLVTVDVTGVWSGNWTNGLHNAELWMELKQDGPKVTGDLKPSRGSWTRQMFSTTDDFTLTGILLRHRGR